MENGDVRIPTARNGVALGIGTGASAASTAGLSAPLASLLGARQWLNTPPLRPDALRGKIVAVNFWTYSCINCLRTQPHVRAWAEKYRDRGLVVVGVHTPEFAFEKHVANVTKALESQGVRYPVAIDSDFAIWRAFDNDAWPAIYFIGGDGRIRHRMLGEGGYDQFERLIQHLLSEANGTQVIEDTVAVSGEDPQAAADERDPRSAEANIDYAKATNFASPGGIREDAPSDYRTLPGSLAGAWTIGGEFATLNDRTGSIAHRFHARDLHLVKAPPSEHHPVRFRIRINCAEPGADHGFNVDADRRGSPRDARMDKLVRQAGPVTDRTFEIEFFDDGVRANSFTFG